eukprot:gb/GECH01004850.1/.p1 GENE.gb/GECH01004850.1/~~gb/GECH01004850.1/.p1  ORF type:complete len:1640 (+),score=346.14 gb/GECH01004850.1/:1-4920(+)
MDNFSYNGSQSSQRNITEPTAHLVPSIAQFKGEIISQLPFPCYDIDKDTLEGKTNLVHDRSHSQSVQATLSSLDTGLANSIHQIMSNSNISYLELNTVGTSLNQHNIKKSKNSNLLNSILECGDIAPSSLENKSFYNKSHLEQSNTIPSSNNLIHDIPSSPESDKENHHPNDRGSNTTLIKSKHRQPKTFKKIQPKKKKISTESYASQDQNRERLERLLVEIFSSEQLNSKQIRHLETEINIAKKFNFLHCINTPDLSKLLNILKNETDFLRNIDSETLEQNKPGLFDALDAGVVVLKILVTKKLPKQLLSEDVIDSVFDGLNTVLSKIVFTFDTSKPKGKKKRNKSKSMTELLDRVSRMFSSLSHFVKKHHLQDKFILKIIDVTIACFFVAEINQIQLSALGVARMVFSLYSEHREYMLREIIVSVLKLPNKRCSRNYKLFDGNAIQIFTALILQLIQSCAPLPPENSGDTSIDDIDEDDDEEGFAMGSVFAMAESVSSSSRLTEAWKNSYACAQLFLTYFLERCASKGPDGDNTKIVEYFLEDLLLVLNSPEWPAADLILQTLSTILCKHLNDTSKEKEKLRHLSVEWLGKIAQTAQREYQYIEEHPFNCNHQIAENQDDSINLSLNSQEASFSVTSPIKTPDRPEPVDIKDRLFKELKTSLGREPGDYELAMYLLFTYLSAETESDPAALNARQYNICQWLSDQEDESVDCSEYLLNMWSTIPGKAIDETTTLPDRSELPSAYRLLASRRKISTLKSFDDILKHILNLMNDNYAKIRSKAVRSLRGIVETDIQVLTREEVQTAIRQRSVDSSISVRESVIELVGKCMTTDMDLIPFYINMPLERVKDTGISVRKRAVNILGDLSKYIKDDELITSICIGLASRMNDETSIKDKVLIAFKDLWFSYSPHDRDDIKRVTLQIVDVITDKMPKLPFRDFDIKNTWFTQLIMQLRSEDSEQEGTGKKHQPKNMDDILMSICDVLVDHIVEIDTSEYNHTKGRYNTISCISTLHLLCYISPPLLKPHLSALEHIFSNDEPDLLLYASSIFAKVFPLLDRPINTSFVRRLMPKLVQNIFKVPPIEVIYSCVQCFCTISRYTNSSVLCQVIDKIVSYLKKQQPPSPSEYPTLKRFLIVLGIASRFYDFDKEPFKNCHQLTRGRCYAQIFGLLTQFAKQSDLPVAVTALSALGYVFIRRPSYFLESTSHRILSSALDINADIDKKKKVLQLLNEFLVEEESEMEDRANDLQNNEDSGLASGILQRYMDSVIKLAFDEYEEVRQNAVEVLQASLRQGLLPPTIFVEPLMSLSTDNNAYVRETSKQLLNFMNERHSSYLQQKFVDGIIKCYEFRKNALKYSDVSGISEETQESLFTWTYKILGLRKTQRKNFFNTFFREMEKRQHDPEFLRYFVETIAYIPYLYQDEVFRIIYLVSKNIDTNGDALLSELQKVFSGEQEISLAQLKKKIKETLYIIFLLCLKNHICITYQVRHFDMALFEEAISGPEKKIVHAGQPSRLGVDSIFHLHSLDTDRKEDLKPVYDMLEQMMDDHMSDTVSLAGLPSSSGRKGKTRGKGKTTKNKGKGNKTKKRKKPSDIDSEDDLDEERIRQEIQQQTKKPPKKKRRKRLTSLSSDESDEDSDEEYVV